MKAAIFLLLLARAAALADFPLPPSPAGDLYLSSSGANRVFCFTRQGIFRFSFTAPGLNSPRGLAFNRRGELYVASQNSNDIFAFKPDGAFLRRFAAPQLSGPTGIAIAPDQSIHAASFNNDQVVVFSKDEIFQQTYTASGLDGPNCVAFDGHGNLFVASQMKSSVFRFDPQLQFLGEFTGGGLSSAMGIALWEEKLFVSGGGSSAVGVFSLDGDFERNIRDASSIVAPQGLAFDDAGRLYASNYAAGTVAVIGPSGAVLSTFGHPGIRLARSLAFRPIPPAVTFIRGDFDHNGTPDLSDAVGLLRFLFLGDPPSGCMDAGDVDDSGELTIGDAIGLLQHLFLGALPPQAPYPDSGQDPTPGDPYYCQE
ncbi:MAG: hypothetical protein HY717_13835 [Planctomycetes bacterium]|nr:hypothetical protein [Planctomycetota bacterium]